MAKNEFQDLAQSLYETAGNTGDLTKANADI
jgi:hypothetical protein